MKFELKINMDNKMFKAEPLMKLMEILTDVAGRLDAQWIVEGTSEGIIWDNDNNSIGSFGVV